MYMDNNELLRYTKVADKDLNEIFQEVNEMFPDKFFVRETTFVTKKWFVPDIVTTTYSVYAKVSTGEVQCINFCREWEYSINTDVPKSYVYTYFMGLLGGYAQKFDHKKLADKIIGWRLTCGLTGWYNVQRDKWYSYLKEHFEQLIK